MGVLNRMFRLSQDDTYLWDVEIKIPRKGRFIAKRFKAEFTVLPQSRIDEIIKSGGDQDLLGEVLCGWDGFSDADGKPIEYTEENRAQALDIPYLRAGLVAAYFDSISGGRARKNS